MICAKQGDNLIPKTRSGKMLRRNLREIVENAANGEIEKDVSVPAVSLHGCRHPLCAADECF